MSESLKRKTVKGVGWSAVDNFVKLGVTFVVSIVLARLLSPSDYGLLGIIQIITVICTAVVNAGFTTALIRKNDATVDDYNTAFIVNLALSIIIYIIIYVCSPFIADFFDFEELTILVRVASVEIVVGALALVPQTWLTKLIDFKTQTKTTLISSVLSGILGIVMALSGYGVWALVFQILSAALLRTILLWYYSKWIPQMRFSQKSFHELFDFGWKIMVSNLLDTIWKELYQVVVGKFYCPATLGQYTRAKQFSNLFSSNLTTVIQRVTYPVLSNIQDDRTRMVSAYRRIIKTTMFVTTFGMFFLGAISQPLLYCLIGPKWHEAAIYLPLICINGSLYPLHAINLNMLQVQGRSDLYLWLEVAKKVIALGPLAIGAFVGIIPMLYSNLVAGAIAYFLNSYYSGRLLGYSSWMQLKDVVPLYGVATIVAAPVFFMNYLPISNWLILPLQFIAGTALFFIICHLIRLNEYKELIGIVRPYLNKQKSNVLKG